MHKIILLTIPLFMCFGCTLRSTEIAQENSVRVQAVQTAIEEDLVRALSRENYETAKLGIQAEVLRAQMDLPVDQRKSLDTVYAKSEAILKEFAQKRDATLSFVKDFERANALKAVSVDAKLFSDIGILNYLGSTLSDKSKDVWSAWDKAKVEFNAKKTSP